MLTKAHFDAAVSKVKGSLDRDAIEKSERQAWEMLYNQDQRTILDKASSAINLGGLMQKKIDDPLLSELRKATYQRKKDFAEITKLTEALEKKNDTQ
jgi:transitional endoplasmic reticulum ATPase